MRFLLFLALIAPLAAQTLLQQVYDVRNYKRGSATFGLQEAVNKATAAGGGRIVIPAGDYVLGATVTVTGSNIDIVGAGVYGTRITRTGDFGDSIYIASTDGSTILNVSISGLYIAHTINYAPGPPPTLVNKPTSGAGIHVFNCNGCTISGNRVENLPYGLDVDCSSVFHAERNQITGLWDYANANTQISIAGIYLHHSATACAGYPTYAYVNNNIILGNVSASRSIIINGHSVTLAEPVGPRFGIWVSSCEVCNFSDNDIESMDYSGIHLASIATHAATDVLLQVIIDRSYIDYSRIAGIDLDMTANPAEFALHPIISNNIILGSGAALNSILFAPPSPLGTYVRTSAEAHIENNVLGFALGSGILMLSGGRTVVTGNTISDYNQDNSYPTNSHACSPICAGDRLGNSGVYIGEAALQFTVTGNTIGGDYASALYNGTSVFTVNGVAIGAVNPAFPGTVAPNNDGGVQAPSARSPAVPFDPAFLVFPGTVANSAANSVVLSGCSATGSALTILSGTVTSGTTGACSVQLAWSTATSPNGWSCSMQNITHPGSTNAMYQDLSLANSVAFTGTTVSGDVLTYSCTAY